MFQAIFPRLKSPLSAQIRANSTTASTQLFRDTMSSIANQTMILTAPHHNEESHIDITKLYKGVTLSSVTSLSINPKPLLQFNLQKPSTTSEFLHSHKYFAIHILAPTIESASLAKLFSRKRVFDVEKGEYVPFAPFKELEKDVDYEVLHKDGVVDLEIDGFTLPILKNNVEKVIICKKYNHFDIQDHEIWIGEIKEIKNYNPGAKTGGLLNFNRNFHIVGNEIE